MENDSLFPDYDGSLPEGGVYKGESPIIPRQMTRIHKYNGYDIHESANTGSCSIAKDGHYEHTSSSLKSAHRWIDVISGKVR